MQSLLSSFSSQRSLIHFSRRARNRKYFSLSLSHLLDCLAASSGDCKLDTVSLCTFNTTTSTSLRPANKLIQLSRLRSRRCAKGLHEHRLYRVLTLQPVAYLLALLYYTTGISLLVVGRNLVSITVTLASISHQKE